jgi:hypothetical protein
LGLTGRKKLGNDWFLVVEVVEAEPLHWFAYPILIAHKRVWRDTSQYRQVFWFCLFAGNGFRYGAGSTRRPVHAGVRPERLGWMPGFPLSEDKVVTQPDRVYFSFPCLR